MEAENRKSITPRKSFEGNDSGGGFILAASLRLISVFSEGKWSIHEKHAEYILILSAASLSLPL